MAVGTNKFSSCIGTSVSTARFWRSGAIRPKVALLSAAGALAGAYLGSRLALLVSEQYLKVVILCLLPFAAVFVLCNRRFGMGDPSPEALARQKSVPLALAIGSSSGCTTAFLARAPEPF
jgi:uncharacterized membrane protein YfcA